MPRNNNLIYRPEIQGLRALAIGLVILAHAKISGFEGGFVGVDVFFVISGYLITQLLYCGHLATGHINFINFLARRLLRLLPALLVMIVFVELLAALFLSAIEFEEQTGSILFASTWTSNLFFAFTTFDYFSELQNLDLFLHTWSLGVEEQFYVLWPLLLMLVFSKTTQQNPHTSRILMIFSIIFAASLSLSIYWSVKNPIWSFYLMPSRVWQFSLGAMAFFLMEKLAKKKEQSSPSPFVQRSFCLSGILGLLLIISSGVFMSPTLVYPGFWALVPSLGAVLVIMFSRQNLIANLLSQRVFVWLGDRSYSWYLWHWPILIIGSSLGFGDNVLETLALVLLSLLMSMFSYRYIELPFWKGRWSCFSALRVIFASITTIVLLTLLIINFSNLQRAHQAANNAKLQEIYQARADIPIIYPKGCDSWYQSSAVKPCLFGNPEAEKTVVLLGDSVMGQWFSLLPEIFASPMWRVIVLTKSSCPMVEHDIFYSRIGKVYKVCSNWRQEALNTISLIKPDVVFMGSAKSYDFSAEQWRTGTAQVLSFLSQVAGRTIVLPGTPSLTFDGPSCLARGIGGGVFSDSKRNCFVNARAKESMKVAGYLQAETKQYENVSLLDLNELVCPKGICSARNTEGMIVFRDSQHLTDSFVRTLVPDVTNKLGKLGVSYD